MESKFKKFITDNKWFVVGYLAWFVLHLIFVCVGKDAEGFWPFTEGYYWGPIHGLDNYGMKEFILYLLVPLVIWIIWKLVGKDIKKLINK